LTCGDTREPIEKVKAASGMKGKFIDTNDDGFISRKELRKLCSFNLVEYTPLL